MLKWDFTIRSTNGIGVVTNGGLRIDLSEISPNESIVYTFKIPVTPYLEKPKINILKNPTFQSKTKVTLSSDQKDVNLRFSFNDQPLGDRRGKIRS